MQLAIAMTPVTLSEVQNAIHTAWKMVQDSTYEGFSVKIANGETVKIMFGKSGNLLNYGFPYTYKLPFQEISSLREWWIDSESTTYGSRGTLSSPDEKWGGVYAVHAIYRGSFTFNFHVPVAK